MKVFIVACAVFMMGFTCLVYETDMGAYMYEQETLKMVTEEASCRGALCLDGEAYSRGEIVFDRELADRCIEEYMDTIGGLFLNGSGYSREYTVIYEDDMSGYAADNVEHCPSVTVEMSITTDDFFRLPVLSADTITRRSKYELKGL